MSRTRYNRSYHVRRAALVRDWYTCQKCGAMEEQDSVRLEVHHLLPLHKGGEDKVSNVVTLCHHCHKRITDRAQSRRGRVDPATGLYRES